MSIQISTTLRAWWKAGYGGRFSSRESLEDWQDRQVKRHIRWVMARSAYYRELYAGLSIENWRNFPVVTRREMMTHFDAQNTVGLTFEQAKKIAIAAETGDHLPHYREGICVGFSTGTSGERGIFVTSAKERAMWGGTIIAKMLPGFGPLIGGETIALFLRSNNALYEQLGSRRIRFHFFNLVTPLEKQVERLNRLNPTVLVAPPSVLEQLALRMETGGPGIRPKKVISVAEVLDTFTRDKLERGFARSVHQIYQATEGLLATTCSHGTLHLNENCIAFQREYLDNTHTHFAPVITDFTRTSQPILRYRLDDVLRCATKPCPCGSPMTAVAAVEGRERDILKFTDPGTGVKQTLYPGDVADAIASAAPNLLDYGATQQGEELHVYLETGDVSDIESTKHKVMAGLDALFSQKGGTLPLVRWISDWPYRNDIKRRRVVGC
ncbi:MAG: adenylate cyclase [Deltaproteobacteria bacterium]|nr:adenylate cyclase [Deltaproteobacteria bacterium]